MTTPATLQIATRAQFARLIGRDRSWVTRMAQAGRLACTDDGRVRVAESIALIEQTAAHRDDVARRHAEARAAANPAPGATNASTAAPTAPPAPTNAATASGTAADPEELVEARRQKILAESRRVQAAADREEMERDKLAGQLLAREDVDAAMKYLGAAVRGLMDVFPDQNAPILAPLATLEDTHAALAEACRNVLVKLGESLDRQRQELGIP